MTKAELIEFLEPFDDEIEILARTGFGREPVNFSTTYEPTGYGFHNDCAVLILEVPV